MQKFRSNSLNSFHHQKKATTALKGWADHMEKGWSPSEMPFFFSLLFPKKLLFQALSIYASKRLPASMRSADPVPCPPWGYVPPQLPPHHCRRTCSHPAVASAVLQSCPEHPSGWERVLNRQELMPALTLYSVASAPWGCQLK